MKNKFMITTALIGILCTATPVLAAGDAKVTFTGSDNIKVGETFTVTMNVTDINNTYDGIVSMGGNLSFDNTKLEYVSSKEVNAPYQFQINESYDYKIAGLDFTLENGIYNTTSVYEFTFKALEEGNTSITLENAKLTDSQDYINTTVISKNVTIEEKDEVIIKNEVTGVKPEAKEVITVKENPIIINEPIKTEEKEIIETKITNEVDETKLEEKVEVKSEIKNTVKKETFLTKAKKMFNGLFIKFKKLFS